MDSTGKNPDLSRIERLQDDAPEQTYSFDPRSSVEKNIAQCAERMKPHTDNSPAVVFIDSPKSILIPAPLFDKDAVDELLELHNFEVGANERVYISPAVAGTVSVIVGATAPLNALETAVGAFQTASPLQYNILRGIPKDKKVALGRIVVYLCPKMAYISVLQGAGSDEKLLFTEALPFGSEADLIYYMDWLGKQFKIAGFPIFIKGTDADKARKAVSRYFKDCRCG